MTARVCCSLTAVLLCLSVYLSTIDAKGRVTIKGIVRLGKEWLPEKPAVCPSNNRLGICVVRENYCFHDGDCPNDQKCCSYGCGRQCMALYREKPGACPSKTLGVGLCVELCSLDSNCPNDQKCCSNGCGHQCMALPKEKPGMCPMTLAGLRGSCEELCVSDFDCPRNEKCCSSICGGRLCTPAS